MKSQLIPSLKGATLSAEPESPWITMLTSASTKI